MNVKVECFVSKPKNRQGYVIEKDGRVVKKDVSSRTVLDLKKAILDTVYNGFCSVKNEVSHDDTLTIVVQNVQTATSLKTRDEGSLKKYVAELDKIFDVMESIDCRISVVVMKKYSAMQEVLMGSVSKIELEGIDSLLEMD